MSEIKFKIKQNPFDENIIEVIGSAPDYGYSVKKNLFYFAHFRVKRTIDQMTKDFEKIKKHLKKVGIDE